ncbi:AAA family ATPase [Enterococcus sp. AZ109]|uniref:AAA family ATPase n=1 Tax=Enterococcus sp. AZ109 TaxID=2774634 RepID=UPI003F2372A5
MKKYLILLAGSPATGKTYLINEIKKAIPELFVLTPDEGKEILADSVGFDNVEEKAELEKRVWKFYYGVLDLYMEAGKRVILSEYPFSVKQADKLQGLAKKYDYQVITVRLVADFDVLWQRRKVRDVANDRHLCHIMTHYHFGDELADRTQADAIITEEEFHQVIQDRGYNNFQLGELVEFDVSDFNNVNYQPFIKELKERIESNQ